MLFRRVRQACISRGKGLSATERPLHIFVMYTLSAVTGNAFPQLLTSLSMAKERYYQSPRVLTYQ